MITRGSATLSHTGLLARALATPVDRGYTIGPDGLSITRALTFDEWRACGVALTEVATRTTWAIGDWLVYGAGRGDYGAFYSEAHTITGRSFESLSQYARVSTTFPLDQRIAHVPWSFYREALRLPAHDRTRALMIAEHEHWTRDGFAAFISTRDGAAPSVAKALSETAAAPRPPGGWHKAKTHHRILQCPSCGFKFEPKRRHRLSVVPARDVG